MTDSWFKSLFGFTENTGYDKNPSLEVHNYVTKNVSEDNIISLHSKLTNRTFQVGKFSILSLDDLRKKTRCYIKTSTKSRALVHHIHVRDIFDEHYKNPGSLFQVASQFNVLEMRSPKNIPELGITDYAIDDTQGPACSLACSAATLYRNYFITVRDIDNNIHIGQSQHNQINNLDDVQKVLNNEFFWMKNGYVFSNKNDLTKLNKIFHNYEEDICKTLKFAIHFNTEVCFIDRFTPAPDIRYVSQIFCSSLSCNYSGIDSLFWEPFARIILKASYEATLLAAIYNRNNGGTNKVFLTLLGGGAFGNKIDWIMDAIQYAIDSIREYHSDLQILICR